MGANGKYQLEIVNVDKSSIQKKSTPLTVDHMAIEFL